MQMYNLLHVTTDVPTNLKSFYEMVISHQLKKDPNLYDCGFELMYKYFLK